MMVGGSDEVRAEVSSVARLWWLWIVAGIIWTAVGMIILQGTTASATTVGVIIGVMFMVAGVQYFLVATQAEGWQWIWWLFGVVLLVGGFIALVYPNKTFVRIADILGFLFALVGIVWVIEAFGVREVSSLWWMSLVSGILMLLIAVWAGSQVFLTKAYTLLLFAGVWAVLRGVLDIVRAFEIRRLGKLATSV